MGPRLLICFSPRQPLHSINHMLLFRDTGAFMTYFSRGDFQVKGRLMTLLTYLTSGIRLLKQYRWPLRSEGSTFAY